jgi:aminomethyltransferase
MSPEPVRTAFDACQRDLGCEFTDWEGWLWPNHFGDPLAEHRAVRESVGVWDESPLPKWDFRGPDALRAADRIFTNDMLGLKVGQVRYAPFCDEHGKMVGDGTVFKFDDEHAWVITALDSDLDHFQQVVAGLDVAIEPITAALPHVQLQGPRSRDVLASLCDADVASLAYFHFFPEQTRVVTRAGARPYGLAAVETLRIESGLIFIGYDYFQHETDPFDMSLDKVIRFDTDDFHGKSALAETRKAPPRRMVTLSLEDGEVPEYGAAVTQRGEPAGTLTSPCESPTLGKAIGLAVLEARSAAHGTKVEVALGGDTVPAAVETLPCYDPEKQRPRS